MMADNAATTNQPVIRDQCLTIVHALDVVQGKKIAHFEKNSCVRFFSYVSFSLFFHTTDSFKTSFKNPSLTKFLPSLLLFYFVFWTFSFPLWPCHTVTSPSPSPSPSYLFLDLEDFLEENRLSDYREYFMEEELDLATLCLMKDEELEKLHLKTGPKQKLVSALHGTQKRKRSEAERDFFRQNFGKV